MGQGRAVVAMDGGGEGLGGLGAGIHARCVDRSSYTGTFINIILIQNILTKWRGCDRLYPLAKE
jgi:hypothetical protein